MSDTVVIEQGVIDGLNTLTKPELAAAADQFGVELKAGMLKDAIVRTLAEDGVTLDLIRGFNDAKDEDLDAEDIEVVEAEPVAEETEEEEDLVLVRMIRANNTYQIRGYTFKINHPFALVKESDADFLIEHDGGFRMASPKEAREFYN